MSTFGCSSLTARSVALKFEKGEASSTFVHSGKVMAFDIAAVSNAMTLPDCTKVGECTMFYGNVVRRRPDLQPLRGRRNVRGFAACGAGNESFVENIINFLRLSET